MQYDLSNELDRQRLEARISRDLASGAVVDYTAHKFITKSQNKYLHLLIGVVAMETGTDIEYAKVEYFKRLVNSQVFVYEEYDKILKRTSVRMRSITVIPSEMLTQCIDKFKQWGREQGWKMPDADEERILRLIEIEMGRNRWL